MEFKLIDKKDYDDNELWTMVEEFPFKQYPNLYEDEFINLYTCNDYPDYLMGYGKILWNGELCNFTLIRTKMLDDICYDEFTTYSSPITIDEKKAFNVFTEYLEMQQENNKKQ